MPQPDAGDIALLVEAYRYGQFADDMLDHPSPSCRSLAPTLRQALRRVLEVWEQQEAIRDRHVVTPSQERYPGEAKALAMEIRDHANSWTINAPRWKRDNMRRAADLLEGI